MVCRRSAKKSLLVQIVLFHFQNNIDKDTLIMFNKFISVGKSSNDNWQFINIIKPNLDNRKF